MTVRVNADTLTTVAGAVMAVGAAVTPIAAASTGTLDKAGLTQLIFAAVMALFGWWSKKEQK